ncbi:hypothetical protein IEO21_04256 [Rhodonia placenta]|uniref:Uncharacterized protein n=1 Tax=Rhodonia placenta TaxID=104341 RepID=A0A8H7P4I3_9APHY|nr:hypothetical protein IEO21_04256 [Postia placenta]
MSKRRADETVAVRDSSRETFYRKELESDVHSAPSKSTEEKRQMLELLKQFKENTMDDAIMGPDNDDDDDDEGDGVDLAERLGGLDIESASYDQIWDALTPAEHEKFMKALGDPTSDMAQQLLASDELGNVRTEPWWEAPMDLETDVQVAESSTPSNRSSLLQAKKFGTKPKLMVIPASMVSPPVAGKTPLLLYNICALCIAYAYVTRHFATSPLTKFPPSDPDRADAFRIISKLVPFLTDRKSKTIHPTLSSVVTDLWSRFDSGEMTSPFFSLLLHDAAALLRPSTVVEVLFSVSGDPRSDGSYPELESHPNTNVLRALSDLSALSGDDLLSQSTKSSPSSSSSKTTTSTAKTDHVTHKLTFYAAHIVSAPPLLLRALAEETAARANAVAREGIALPDCRSAIQSSAATGSNQMHTQSGLSRIIELS